MFSLFAGADGGGAKMDPNQLIKDVEGLFDLVTNTQTSSTLIVIGLIVLVLGVVIGVKIDFAKSPRSLRYAFIGCVSVGVLFCAAGPLFALLNLSKYPIQRVLPSKAFDNLETNERVTWLIRLIPYDPENSGLAIGNLKQIGPPDQQYSFVASDDELAGYTVEQAVRMTGIPYSHDQRVSAIIFPVPHQPSTRTNALYPANARGLLQVIQNVEANTQNKIENTLFTGSNTLRDDEAADLRNYSALNYWRWDNYFKFYPRYCQIAHDFECDVRLHYSAHSYLSGPNTDWHPLGLAQIGTQKDACDIPVADYCKVSDLNSANNSWKSKKAELLKSFGSRIFLMQNLKIESIKDRVMIDFGEPDKQYIPNMTLRPSPQ
jgi:hypothetical protein